MAMMKMIYSKYQSSVKEKFNLKISWNRMMFATKLSTLRGALKEIKEKLMS